MKVFRIINKSFRDAFKSIIRNFSLSLASISCTAITLILVAIALLVTYNVNSITKKIENTLSIVAYINTDATQEQIDQIKYEVESLANVNKKTIKFKGKEELKEEFMQDETVRPILETLDKNTLKSMITVTVLEVRDISETALEISKIEGITDVNYGETLVNQLVSFFEVARNACIIAVIALLLVTLFLNENTIKITIFSRRQEIGIMRLVGTSNIVIKMPFIIEGFILGIIGAIVPVLITIFGYTFLYDYQGGKLFSDILTLVNPSEIIYLISIVMLIIGGLVGMFGSLRAVRRYLKV